MHLRRRSAGRRILLILHFWRVRKDSFFGRPCSEEEKVDVWPNLIVRNISPPGMPSSSICGVSYERSAGSHANPTLLHPSKGAL